MSIDTSKWQRQAVVRLAKNPNGVGSPNYPVLLDENSFRGGILNTSGNNAQSDGGDLRFSLDKYGRFELPCQVVTWTQSATPASRRAQVWVKIPRWKDDSVDFIYVWWKTATTDTQPPVSNASGKWKTWPDWYKHVYHCEGGSGNLIDSAKAGYNLTAYGSPGSAAGPVQNARSLVRTSSQYFLAGSNIGISGSTVRMIECWVYLTDTSRAGIVGWGANSNGNEFYLSIRNNHWYVWGYGGGYDWDTGVTPSTGTWYHVVLTYANSHYEMYVNGSRIGTGFDTTAALNTTDAPLNVGREIDGGTTSYLNGRVDEVRVMSGTIYASTRAVSSYSGMNAPENYFKQMDDEATSGIELKEGGWERCARLTIGEHGGDFDSIDALMVLTEACIPSEILDSDHPTKAYGASDVRLTLDRHGLEPVPLDIRTFTQSSTPANRKFQGWFKFPQWRMDLTNELWVWWRRASSSDAPSYSDTGKYTVYDEETKASLTMIDGANPIDDQTMYQNVATGYGNLPTPVPGKIGNAQDLNGSTDYMVIPSDPSMRIGTGQFTIALWIKADAVTGATRQVYSMKPGTGEDLELEINTSGKLEVFSTGLELTSSATLSVDTWYHVVLVRDSSNNLRLYINGTQDNSVGSFTNDIGISDMYIGRDAGTGQFFDGLIDQFILSLRAMTAYDVRAMYDNQNDPSALITAGDGMDVDLFWGYEYEREMEIDNTYIDAILSGLPVCLTEANLPSEMFSGEAQRARDDGGDLAIGSTDGRTRYPIDVVHWDESADEAEVWVRIPSVSATAKTPFKLYWKKPGQAQPAPDKWYGQFDTWDRFFLSVWHLNDKNINGTQFVDKFMGDEWDPFWTGPSGAGAVPDVLTLEKGRITGGVNGVDTQFFDEAYTGSWTIEVHGDGNNSQAHGIRMQGDGGTVIQSYANGTNLVASMTGQTTDTDATPFTNNKVWLRIVYNASAQTVTFYYSVNANNKPESNPDPWVQHHQYTGINLGSEKFAPEFNNTDGGDWRYVKATGSAGSPGTFEDRTRYQKHLFTHAGLPDPVDALVFEGQDFEASGADEYAELADGIPEIVEQNITLEGATKRESTVQGYLMSQGNQSSANRRLHFGFRDSDTFTFAFWTDDLDADITPDTTNYHHYAGTFDAASRARKIYEDGSQIGSDTASSSLNVWDDEFTMGTRSSLSAWYDGILDEPRISTTIRSAAWLKATWNTMKNTALFCAKVGSGNTRRRILGRLMFQGNKLVDLKWANRVPQTEAAPLTKWLNKGTELGDFQKMETNAPIVEDERGYQSVRFDTDADIIKSSFPQPSSLLGSDKSWAMEAWVWLGNDAANTDKENTVSHIGRRNTANQAANLNSGHQPLWGAGSFGNGNNLSYNPTDLLIRLQERDDDWAHLVMTYNDDEDSVWIFVNGEENNILTSLVLSLVDNTIGVCAGGQPNGTTQTELIPFVGDIAALRIYDGHMGIGDIVNNYNLGLHFQSQIKKLVGADGLSGGGLTKGALT